MEEVTKPENNANHRRRSQSEIMPRNQGTKSFITLERSSSTSQVQELRRKSSDFPESEATENNNNAAEAPAGCVPQVPDAGEISPITIPLHPRTQPFDPLTWSLPSRKRKRRSAKPRMNYFLALRINSSTLMQQAADVQDAIASNHPHLASAFTSVKKLHLTLFVMHLPSEEEVQKAQDALHACKDIVDSTFETHKHCTLSFSGLSTFQSRVVWIKVEETEERKKLEEMVVRMHSEFSRRGIVVEELGGWTPHVTMMKLRNRKRVKKIASDVWEGHSASIRDSQSCTEIQLLSMVHKPTEDGYYRPFATLFLREPPASSSDLEKSSDSSGPDTPSAEEVVFDDDLQRIRFVRHKAI